MAITLRFLAAAVAGFLAWALIEPTNPGLQSNAAWSQFELRLTLLLGAFVGATVGGLNGLSQGSRTHALRGLGLGALLGAIGASFGYGIGGGIVRAMFGGIGTGLFSAPLTRIIALTPMGIMLGVAIGASSFSQKRIIQGAIGGAIGSALGAGVFDLLGSMLGIFQLTMSGVQPGQSGEVGTIPRAVYATCMGGFIGLFIGLVDLMARSAWLRLNLGRNEGKEWSLDFANTFIGRSETAQVPLFGDPNVGATHAVIRKHGKQYVLQDGGTPMGTLVNGHRVQQHELHPGDVIQIGGYALQFLVKNQAAPVRPVDGMIPGGYPYPQAPQPPMPQTTPFPSPGQMPTMAVPAQPALNVTVAYGSAMPTGWGLVVLDGPLAGQRFPVTSPIELGRGSIVLAMGYDQQASRRHAVVAADATGIAVNDLGSTNGTFVNSQRVTTAIARPGDIIRIGSTSFRVEPV